MGNSKLQTLTPKLEAVLLTGGASRRMGQEKSKLLVAGEPLGQRIARLLTEGEIPVTVLGREPLPGCSFVADEEELAGPLAALARFTPSREFVFICSCDVPGFSPELVSDLESQISHHEAAVPVVDGRLQPLCALYHGSAFAKATDLVRDGEKRIMRWVDALNVVHVSPREESWASNVNTPEEWNARAQPSSTSESAF